MIERILMNKAIAEFEGNVTGNGIAISTYDFYHSSWDKLMPVAKRLHEISKYEPVSFNKNILDFDIEKVHESVYSYIIWLNKKPKD